jgi:hypothetical protein
VRDEDIVDPRSRHHLGLADLGDGDATRSAVELKPGDLRRLVGLRVGAERDVGIPRGAGHPIEVRLEAVEVDQQGWRVEIRDQHGVALRLMHAGSWERPEDSIHHEANVQVCGGGACYHMEGGSQWVYCVCRHSRIGAPPAAVAPPAGVSRVRNHLDPHEAVM